MILSLQNNNTLSVFLCYSIFCQCFAQDDFDAIYIHVIGLFRVVVETAQEAAFRCGQDDARSV